MRLPLALLPRRRSALLTGNTAGPAGSLPTPGSEASATARAAAQQPAPRQTVALGGRAGATGSPVAVASGRDHGVARTGPVRATQTRSGAEQAGLADIPGRTSRRGGPRRGKQAPAAVPDPPGPNFEGAARPTAGGSATAVLDVAERAIDHGQNVGVEPIIAIRHVSRSYGGPSGTVALEDANLAIWPGEFVVILGPSGSGKSTLLNLIGGMDQASTGDVVATGYRISGASPGGLARYRRESVSFIFQTFNLFPALTAVENVEFGANVARRRNSREAAVAMLQEVGLGHRLNHFPHMLSGGEQQRVAIARALATGNKIVLADEPTGELDFRTGLQILELLLAQARTGRAVIVVTHNREIARVADRVIELSSGRIVADRVVGLPRPSLEDLHW